MLSKFFKLRFDLIFFYIFVFLLPLEKKHVLIPNLLNLPTDLSTKYSAWGAIEIYLTDIVFTLVLGFWLLYLLTLSTGYAQLINRLSTYARIVILLGIFLAIAVISTSSFGLNKLEIYHLTKLLEYISLFVYVVLNIDSLVKLLYTIGAFILSSFFQASLGITQYFLQHSLNLKLFGEVDLSPQIQNVAKIVVNGEKYIRAYGTFPHANIFGGFIFIGLMLLLAVYFSLLFKKQHNCSTWNRFRRVRESEERTNSLARDGENGCADAPQAPAHPTAPLKDNHSVSKLESQLFHVEHSELFLLPLLILTFIGLVLSFSRSAWLAFIIGCLIFGVFMFRIVPRGTLRKSSFVRPFCLLLLGIITILVIFLPKILAKTNQFDQFGDKALSGRIEYTQIALKMVKKSPFFGIGHGNFVNEMQGFVDKPLEWWQFQPVHNVFLLILAETGILGLVMFIGFIGFYAYRAVRSLGMPQLVEVQNNNLFTLKILSFSLFAVFSGLLIIMLLDHYLWDIQQGALLFWLIAALTLICSTWRFGRQSPQGD